MLSGHALTVACAAANSALVDCQRRGGSGCDARAIRIGIAAGRRQGAKESRLKERVKPPATEGIREASAVRIAEFSGSLTEVKVDLEKMIVYGARLLNPMSRNRRDYAPAALASAARLSEGAKVFVDHAEDEGGRRRPRSVRELAAIVRGAKVNGQAVTGDLHVMPDHRWLAERAQLRPEGACLSINADALVQRGLGGERDRVLDVTEVHSVDVVSVGGTTASLFEGKGDAGVEFEKLTEAELRAKRPDLVSSIEEAAEKAATADGETARRLVESESITKQLKEQLAASAKALEEAKAREAEQARKAGVDQAIADAKLPKEAVSEVFVAQCLAAKDAAALKSLIEDRVKLAGTKPQPKTPAGSIREAAGDGDGGGSLDPEALRSALLG